MITLVINNPGMKAHPGIPLNSIQDDDSHAQLTLFDFGQISPVDPHVCRNRRYSMGQSIQDCVGQEHVHHLTSIH